MGIFSKLSNVFKKSPRSSSDSKEDREKKNAEKPVKNEEPTKKEDEPVKDEGNALRETVQVPEHLTKYIIGTKGATIREIQEKAGEGTRVQVENGGQVVITADSAKAVQEAKKLVLAVCDEHSDKVGPKSPSKTYDIPSNLHRYAIGEGGKHIKVIQKCNASKIEFDGDKCTITSNKESGIESSFKEMLDMMKEYGWHYDSKKNSFYEINRVGEFADKARAAANAEAELRNKCYEESKAAFESGDKAKAKELSDEGREHDAKFKELQKEACKKIFEFANEGNDFNTVDLHGLLVDEAITIVKERVELLQKSGEHSQVSIITGAGLHSDKKGPKIKPKIVELLSSAKLTYTQPNHGTFEVALK